MSTDTDGRLAEQPDLVMWAGAVTFAEDPKPGHVRLLIEEHEHVSADYVVGEGRNTQEPGRPIYAESFELDGALLRSD